MVVAVCLKKNELMLAYGTAESFYTFATNRLGDANPITDKDAYEDLTKISEDARAQCIAARSELDRHTLTHAC
jgi:hypothetical protein